MAGLFYLLTLYFAIRSFASSQPLRWQAAAVIACGVGMTAKEIVATAPILVFLYDWIFVSGKAGQTWRLRRTFYLSLASGWVLFAALLMGTGGANWGHLKALFWQVGGQPNRVDAGQISWLNYALTQFGAVLQYLRLSVWPRPLILDYGSEVMTGFRDVVAPAMVILLLLAGTVTGLCRRSWVGFAGAWFFLILAPTSSVIPLAGQTIAEHRMYLPLAAVIALAVVGGYSGWCRLLPQSIANAHRRRLVKWVVPSVLAIGLVSVLGGLAFARNADYQSEYTIMLDTVRKRPTNPRAHNSLGFALAEQGRSKEAVEHYETALQLDPAYADAHNNLGIQLTAQGRLEEAVQHFQQALKVKPRFGKAHNNLGAVLARQMKFTEALAHFQRALQLRPDYATVHNNLGTMLVTQKKLADAIPHFELSLQLMPDQAEVHHALGNALAALGKFGEAIGHFAAAIRLKPGMADAHCNLGASLLAQGKVNEAIRCYETALRLQPDSANAHRYLGDALAAQGNWPEAGRHYARAVQLDPNHADARNNLGNALATFGKWDEAIAHFEAAIKLKPDMAEAHGNLAGALANHGKQAEAIPHFQQALELATSQGNAQLADSIRARLEASKSPWPQAQKH
jgi:tetratricopeptide (TPR) repeat protein